MTVALLERPAMLKALETDVYRVRGARTTFLPDWVAVERPLEIRVRTGNTERVISTTMRTPADDRALAVGFLFAERVVRSADQIRAVHTIDDDTVLIDLDPSADTDAEAARRPFVTSGACGVCGRGNLDALLDIRAGAIGSDGHGAGLSITADVVHALPGALRTAQAAFARTGGLHAAGLFTVEGVALAVQEDVGRHNAVDKLVGALILEHRLPDPASVLVVSGRASFELVQKAVVAGLSIMVAVGAPSSLAVEMARGAGMTLLGFVRDRGFNVYCGAHRISGMT